MASGLGAGVGKKCSKLCATKRNKRLFIRNNFDGSFRGSNFVIISSQNGTKN